MAGLLALFYVESGRGYINIIRLSFVTKLSKVSDGCWSLKMDYGPGGSKILQAGKGFPVLGLKNTAR